MIRAGGGIKKKKKKKKRAGRAEDKEVRTDDRMKEGSHKAYDV